MKRLLLALLLAGAIPLHGAELLIKKANGVTISVGPSSGISAISDAGAVTLGAAGGATITASGFDGNLTTSDDTLQEVAQKLDDLTFSGTFGETSLAGLVNNQTLWNSANASRTLTFGLSGATDPVFTISNGIVNLTTGALQVGGSAVADSATTLTIAGTANEITSSAGAQSLAANRTWTLSLPSALTFTGKTVTGGTHVGPAVGNGATGPGYLDFLEDTDSGSNRVRLIGPSSVSDITVTLPTVTGLLASLAADQSWTGVQDFTAGSINNMPIGNTTPSTGTFTAVLADSIELTSAAAPTVNTFGEMAADNNLWAVSRGAPVFNDGTAAVALVGTLASDTPSNGQVPKWNTGGTITWEDVGTSSLVTVGALNSGSITSGFGSIDIGTDAFTAGVSTFTAPVRTSGTAAYITVNIPADTGITAATESIGVNHVTATRTWADGTVTLQRENFWAGPTYNKTTTSATFTDAFTGYMTPPIAGTGVTFTRGHTFGIVDSTSASSSITGGFVVATTLGTTATSVGIGGGNINAGGTITAGGAVTGTGFIPSSSNVPSNGMYLPSANQLGWSANGAVEMLLGTASLTPGANDGNALGSTTLQWGDLFLAEGGVINWDNGDATLTQTGNVLALAGADLQVATADVGTNADSVPTISSTNTFTNKTLTAPKFADLGFIADANGNELFILDTVTSAVNEITFANAATGANPQFSATGGDTDVGINFLVKAAGKFRFLASASGPAELRLLEDSDNGTNYAGIIAPASMSGDRTITLFDASDTVVGKATTDTLTNKTFDAADTGNVLKAKGYIYLTHPHLADGTNATINTTATSITYGHATFSNSVDKASNYVEYYLQVPEDLDTAVALRGRLKQLLGNTDTGKQGYEISSVSVADSAVPTASTLANAIAINFAGDASGANGDVETSAWTTLTSWAGALTAGQTWRIRLARDGDDGTNDTSTVNSTELGLVIEYGITQ